MKALNWKKAITSSAIVAFVFAVLISLFSSGGRIYIDKVEWDKVDVMPYREAQQYLADRSKNISRFLSLWNAKHYPEFWLVAASDFVLFFVPCLSSCLLYGRSLQLTVIRLEKPKPEK